MVEFTISSSGGLPLIIVPVHLSGSWPICAQVWTEPTYHTDLPVRAESGSTFVTYRRRADWLDTCLHELDEIDEEAREEGIQLPSGAAKAHARRLLRYFSLLDLPEPSVYPTENGEVAIYFSKSGSGVLIHCGASGEAACFSRINGRNRRARYDTADDLPDHFLGQQLAGLEDG